MALSTSTSTRMDIARVVCIFFVIYVHIGIGLPDSSALGFQASGLINMAKLVIRDGLGRGGLPLLSIISGYLAVISYERYGIGKLIKKKSFSILYPMVVWSLILMLAYLAVGLVTNDPGFLQDSFPSDTLGWLNAFFAVTDSPFNRPMYFLRDVYICFLMLPAFYWAAKKLPGIATTLAVTLFFLSVPLADLLSLGGLPLFLRPSIPGLFLLGILIQLGYFSTWSEKTENFLHKHILTLLIAVCLSVLLPHVIGNLLGTPVTEADVIHPASRLFSILFIWSLTIRASGSKFAQQLLRLSKASFLVFCYHVVFKFLATQVLGVLYGWHIPGYIQNIVYFTLPVVCFAFGAVLWHTMHNHTPTLSKVLLGSR